MLAVNYSAIRKYLKNYCDKAADEEAVIVVTRKMEIFSFSPAEVIMRMDPPLWGILCFPSQVMHVG